MTTANRPRDELHQKHIDALKLVVNIAHEVLSPLMRIMTSKKEQILWGEGFAEPWNVAKGAWDTLPPLIAPAVKLARAESMTLVVETGNGTMVNSNYTSRKLIDELDAKDVLKVLWDPANNCWSHEQAYPAGYGEIRDGYLGHLHIKDVKVDRPRASLEVREISTGQLADMFAPMAAALVADSYDSIVSLESVYHSGNGNFEDWFRQCVGLFK